MAGHVSSKQWRVSDTLTTTPHPYTPHCAPLVRGYLRLTARVMPPAWSPDRSGLRGCGAPLFGAACTGCGRFRSTLSRLVEWCTAQGAKEGKDGRRRWCHWQRRAFPRRPSFPFPSSGDARHSAADDRRWRNPILASERSRGGGIPADDRCVMHGVDTTGTPAQVRCQKPAPPGAKAR